MKLSIIVPVYNVEAYISPCLESVFRQGLDEKDFEVIVVNDATPDRSMELVDSEVKVHPNIVVKEHTACKGLSEARNTGLANAKGQYVLFVDSDDLLFDGMLSYVLKEAEAADADMTVAGFVKMDDKAIAALGHGGHDERNGMVTHNGMVIQGESRREMSGREFFLSPGFNPRECYVWRTLYKRAFLADNALRFIPGIYFEDVPFTTECYLRARKCLFLDKTLYIYRQRANSIVSSMSMRKLADMNTVLACLTQMRNMMCDTDALRCRMDDTLFATFSISVWYLVHDKTLLAEKHLYIADLKRKVPDLNFCNGLKQRCVAVFFRLMPRTFIWLRASFVSKK